MSLLEAVRNKEMLSDSELYDLVYYNIYKDKPLKLVDEKIIGTTRWENIMFTIFKENDEYIGIVWQKGKTEMQEDVFSEQPKLYTRVAKTVYEYVAK